MRKWFERLFRALQKAIESFLREFQPPLQPIFVMTLDPPADFGGRIPIFAGNYYNTGEILMISHPGHDAVEQRYGFHHISLKRGMLSWDSDFYDDGLTTVSTQIMHEGVMSNAASHLALVAVERFDPSQHEVRVYNARCESGNWPPIFNFVKSIHVNEEIAGMSTFYNRIWVVTKEGILHLYAPVQVNEDLDLVVKDYGLKNAGFQIMHAYILHSGILIFEGKLGNEVQVRWCLLNNTSTVYFVPNPPPWAGRIGPICRDLAWISGPGWAQLLVTGTHGAIWMYYYPGIGPEFHLVKFQASDGTTHEGYQLPVWGNWDVRFFSDEYDYPMIDPSGTVDDTGEVVLLLAVAGRWDQPGVHKIQLAVRPDASGQHTFREVSTAVQSANSEFMRTFWHHDSRYQRSRFDVFNNGRIQWTHEGRRE